MRVPGELSARLLAALLTVFTVLAGGSAAAAPAAQPHPAAAGPGHQEGVAEARPSPVGILDQRAQVLGAAARCGEPSFDRPGHGPGTAPSAARIPRPVLAHGSAPFPSDTPPGLRHGGTRSGRSPPWQTGS